MNKDGNDPAAPSKPEAQLHLKQARLETLKKRIEELGISDRNRQLLANVEKKIQKVSALRTRLHLAEKRLLESRAGGVESIPRKDYKALIKEKKEEVKRLDERRMFLISRIDSMELEISSSDVEKLRQNKYYLRYSNTTGKLVNDTIKMRQIHSYYKELKLLKRYNDERGGRMDSLRNFEIDVVNADPDFSGALDQKHRQIAEIMKSRYYRDLANFQNEVICAMFNNTARDARTLPGQIPPLQVLQINELLRGEDEAFRTACKTLDFSTLSPFFKSFISILDELENKVRPPLVKIHERHKMMSLDLSKKRIAYKRKNETLSSQERKHKEMVRVLLSKNKMSQQKVDSSSADLETGDERIFATLQNIEQQHNELLKAYQNYLVVESNLEFSKILLKNKDMKHRKIKEAIRNEKKVRTSIKHNIELYRRSLENGSPGEFASMSNSEIGSRITEMKQKAKCPICKKNNRNCFLEKCGHSFCTECVLARLRKKDRRCPVCGERFQKSQVKALTLE